MTSLQNIFDADISVVMGFISLYVQLAKFSGIS